MIKDNFTISLKPTLDFNIDNIQKEIDKHTLNINTRVKINKEELLKDIQKVKLDFELNIDKKNINHINKQINSLRLNQLKPLNKVKLDFELNITKKNINHINKQIKNDLSELKKVKINIESNIETKKDIKGIKEEISSKGIDNSRRDDKIESVSSLISHQEKSKDGLITDVANTYRENALEIQKVIDKYDAEGNKIETIIEKTKEYEKASKSLHDTLKKQNQELSKLDNERMLSIASGNSSKEYDNLIAKQKQLINNTEKEIELLGLQNAKSQQSIDIDKKSNQLKEQAKLYKELEKNLATLRELENKKAKGLEINASEYDAVINKQKDIIFNIREMIKERQLENRELQEQIINIERIQALSVSDKSSIKEQTRQAKLGELYATKGQKGLTYESTHKELEEFGKKTYQHFEKITSVKNKVQDLTNAQKQFTVAVKTGKGQVTEYTYAIDKASGNMYKLGEKIRRVNTTIAGSGALLKEMVEKIAQWNIATTVVFKSLELFQKGVQYIVELDSVLTEITLVTGQTAKETEKLKETYASLGRETSKTVLEIAKLNAELLRQGLSQQETQQRLDSILKLSAVSGMDTNQTLQVITSSVNALGEEAKKTADVLVYADNQSASSVESIGKAMTKVSSNAKESGLSIEQLVGQIATLIDVTQEAPETLGNAMKSMLARFSKINEIGEFNEDLNEVEKAFTSVGIAFKDSEGQIRPFFDLMTDMSKVFPTLDKNTKSMIATLSAGTQQQNRFLALVQNWDRVVDLTKNLETQASGSLEKGFSVWENSIEAHLNQLEISFQEFWHKIIDPNAIKLFIDMGNIFIQVFSKINEIINIPALGLLALIRKLDKMFLKGTLTKPLESQINILGRNIINLTKNTTKQIVAQKQLNQENRKSINPMQSFTSAIKQNNATMQRRKELAKKIAVQQKVLTRSINATKIAMIGLNVVSSLGIGLLIEAGMKFAEIIFYPMQRINDLKEKMQGTVSSFREIQRTHKDEISTLKEVQEEYELFNKKIGENYDLSVLSNEEKERYLEIMSKISDIAPEFISHWDTENGAMIKYGTTMEEIIRLKEKLYQIEKQGKIEEFKDTLPDLSKIVKSQAEEIQRLEEKAGFRKREQSSGIIADTINTPQQQIAYQQSIILDPNTSAKNREKAQKEIEKIKLSIESLENKISAVNIEIDKNLATFKEIIGLDLADYFAEIGDSISEADKSLILQTATEFGENLMKQGKGKEALTETQIMAISLVDMSKKVNEALQGIDHSNISDSVDELEKLKAELVSLGLNSDEASSYVDNLSARILNLSTNTDKATFSIKELSSEIGNNFAKMKNWQELLQKSFTKSLSIDEVFKVMSDLSESDLPDFIQKINSGMDINNAIGEVALAQIEKINNETITSLNNAEKENEIRKRTLQEQQREYEKTLQNLEKKGKTETGIYKEYQKALNETINEIANIDEQTKKNMSTVQAYKKISEDFFAKDQFNVLSEQFNQATNNIQKYQEMLNTINEQGLTKNIISNIIANYPHLLQYINDEIGLRNALNNLIASEEQIQKQSYRLKLLYSENFANSFLKLNSDMLNQLGNKYNIDLKNFKSVQEQKVALLNSMNMQLAKSNAQLSSNFANMSVSELKKEISERESRNQQLLSLGVMSPTQQQEYNINKAQLEKIKDQLAFAEKTEQTLDLETGKIQISGGASKVPTSGVSSSKKTNTNKKTHIDLIKLEKEEYLKLNKALEKNNRLTEKNSILEKYAFDEDKLKIIAKENTLLSERQKLLHNLANKYREEQAELKKSISKVIKLGDDEGLSNFTAYMKNKENEINNLIKKINATTNQSTVENLTSQKEVLEKQVNEFAEEYKRYVEITFSAIPDLQQEYNDLIFQKFDNTLKAMQTRVEKYEKEVGRLNVLQKLSITGKRDNNTELERELKIHEQISTIYFNELSITKEKAEETKRHLDSLETKLKSIKDTNSADYQNTYTSLMLAKKSSDEALKMYEMNLEAYADSLNSKVNIEIQLLDKIKENAKESLQDLRKELDEFTMTNFTNNIEKIKLELDKIDKIFIENPKFTLDTTHTRDDLADIEKSINDIRKNTDKWKKKLDDVKNSNKFNKDTLKEIDIITKALIETENKLNEEIAKKNEEILKLELEYAKIENSLQNQIDLKQEEIEKIQEEKEHNQKINDLISKRLQLLRAIDDTSHMYITGQGEVEWTYDKGLVSSLLEQFSQEEIEDESSKKISQIQEEIDKMVENLNTTKNIHQQNLAVNQAQLQQLEQEKNYISSLIDESLNQIDKNFDKMIDKYIDDVNAHLQKNTSTLIDIYNLLKDKIITNNFNYGNINKTRSREVFVGKNEETLEKIAKKYNTTIDELLKLNKNLSRNSKLFFGEKINIPSFDTGGYTGSFGKEGRLAILHEKELVLNKFDTKNLLDLVNISREILFNNKLNLSEYDKNQIINIHNLNLSNVNNVNDFVNDLQRIARNGFGRLN